MFLKIFYSAFLFLGIDFVYAEELRVLYGRQKITLLYSAKELSLKGHLLDLKIKGEACNKHIIKRFQSDLRKVMKTSPLKVQKVKKGVQFIYRGKSYYGPSSHPRALYLLKLPKIFQKMKLEEKFACQKKKKS